MTITDNEAVRPAFLPLLPITGQWHQSWGTPYEACAVRLDVPLTAEHMVAALYGESEQLQHEEIEANDRLWERIGVIIATDGMRAIAQRVGSITEQERTGTLVAPDWLAYCRGRVAEAIERQWEVAKHRCPCGYATSSANVFDDHLDCAEDDQTEHFEALDGWTHQQVRDWQASAAANPV